MRKILLLGAAFAAATLATGGAEAKSAWYFGARADGFIARYLPNASLPGDINQAFVYGPGKRRHGWASCHVPAMGERSDGVVSRCYVKF